MYKRPDHVLASQETASDLDPALDNEQVPPSLDVPRFPAASVTPSASERGYDDDQARAPEREAPPTQAIMDGLEETDGPAITEAAARYGFNEVEIRAIITTESRGVATANAGRSQRDGGRNAASGLMQVTAETWRSVQNNHPELRSYAFAQYRYNRRINILFGAAALADKRSALEQLGVQMTPETQFPLLFTAYNAGEGIVSGAYQHAVDAGSAQPDVDCLEREHLMAAIERYPSVYSYYLTGGGRRSNPQRTVERAIELKYLEISRYPNAVQALIADDRELGQDGPKRA